MITSHHTTLHTADSPPGCPSPKKKGVTSSDANAIDAFGIFNTAGTIAPVDQMNRIHLVDLDNGTTE